MKRIVTAFFVIFISLVFILTVKGNYGNPTPSQIYDEQKVMGQAFELSPERGRYALTMALAQDRSFYLRQDIARIVTPDLGFYKGKYMLLVSPGLSMLGVPFYLLGAGFNLAQVFTFGMPAFFAVLNFLLILKICEQLKISFRAAILSGLSYLFATTAFAYSVSYYQHQITAFLLLATAALLFGKKSVLRFGVAAFLVGFSFWIDSQNPIFFIPLVFYAIQSLIKVQKDNNYTRIFFNIRYILAVVGIVVALGAYSIYSFAVFQKPFQLSGTLTSIKDFDQNNAPVVKTLSTQKEPTRFFNTRRMTNGFATLVFKEDRGTIYYAPIILIGILGVSQLIKKKYNESVALLGTILFIFVLYTMWGDPWGGWAFGPRYLIPLFAFAGIFIGQAVDLFRKNILFRLVFILLFAYGLAVNLLGTLTTNQIPPEVEAVVLGMKWNYLLNWDLFQKGLTSAFFYKTYLTHFMTLEVFYIMIFVSIISVAGLTLFFPERSK